MYCLSCMRIKTNIEISRIIRSETKEKRKRVLVAQEKRLKTLYGSRALKILSCKACADKAFPQLTGREHEKK